MIKIILLTFFPFVCFSQMNKTVYPIYKGTDLGVHYSPSATNFKIWAPIATAVKLHLYKEGSGGSATDIIDLQKAPQGIWQISVKKKLKNIYYTFQVTVNGKVLAETPDIYAKAVGVNGQRGMVINMAETNPINWQKDTRPEIKSYTDIVLYESHVRDLSINKNSGIKNKGKFLGLAEAGTKSSDGLATGLDHLKELGITHLHLLPSFDFNSVDETTPDAKYNWGYDPLNYNVPEGSYATDAYDGKVRIKEFKQMVQTLHSNGIRVIMDVVYNHTSNTETPFNLLVPDYFYRKNAAGRYSDATGCGNETASEKAMLRKFIIESVTHWVKEYHVDGFRFDLMGVHDIETMNEISNALYKIDKSIFIYGEGWTAGASPLPEELRAVKKNVNKLNNIAAFSDDIRDGLHGPYNNVKEKGFVSGATGLKESIKFGIVASTQHPQINYKQVNYSKAPWAKEPSQTISYVSCHDDNTLFDRLTLGNPNATEAELIRMDKLSQTIVLTSQGVPFIHSGAEMLRTKKGFANSYNLPDSINEIDWSRKLKYKNVFNYYKGLITLRKNHPAFRMPTSKMIQNHLAFTTTEDPLLVIYQINNHANNDKWKDIIVLLNGEAKDKNIQLPLGKWTLVTDGNTINEKSTIYFSNTILLPATTGYILYKMD